MSRANAKLAATEPAGCQSQDDDLRIATSVVDGLGDGQVCAGAAILPYMWRTSTRRER